MKALFPGLVLVASLAACDQIGHGSADGPIYIYGSADPRTGEGMTSSVSKLFERAEVEKLHARLNSKDFQEKLTRYSCGDQVPKVDFTLSLWPEGEYQERHVLVQPRPMFSPSGRTRCLGFGLTYLIAVEVAALDKGPPINYHYHDPHTGKELPPETYAREVPQEPRCDCSRADSGKEWVTWPGEQN